MTKLRGELSYTGFKMAFWLGTKIKSLSCYPQKTGVTEAIEGCLFRLKTKEMWGNWEERQNEIGRGRHCICGLGPLILSFCEIRKIEFGGKQKLMRFSASPWNNYLVWILRDNLSKATQELFFLQFFFSLKEEQSNWKLTHNLRELQSLGVGMFPESVWWPGQPASFQWLLGWD